MSQPKRVLVVGLGNMGMSHALAYSRIEGFEVAGLCTRGIRTRAVPDALAGAPRFTSFAGSTNRNRSAHRWYCGVLCARGASAGSWAADSPGAMSNVGT